MANRPAETTIISKDCSALSLDANILDDRGSEMSSYNSIAESVSITLPNMNYGKKKKRRSRLPGPLKLPKSFQPRVLTPMKEQILAKRLSKVPERWDDKYGEDVKQKRMFVAKKVTPTEVDRIVRRLSNASKQETPPKIMADDEILFEFEREEKEEGERKFEENEVERLVQRLTRVTVCNRKQQWTEPERRSIYLTAYEIHKLNERLCRPRSYSDPDLVCRVTDKNSRFIGRKMTQKDIDEMVVRISRSKPKNTAEEQWQKRQLGYFNAWTSCDADYNQWRMDNKE